MTRLLAAGLLLALGGCAPDLAALAQDKNALCVRATWVGGSVELSRNWGCERQAAVVMSPP